MARQTVAFRVAAHARLEALAGRLTVPNQEELPRVMIPRPQHSCRDQSRARVTTGAERTDVVAIAARRLTGIRGGGMARQRPVRMIARPARGARPVAFQAIGAYVAAGAAGRGCSRCQMSGSDAVTIEAALDDRLTHSHARLADDRVTARAGWRLISRFRRVIHVIEAQIAPTH